VLSALCDIFAVTPADLISPTAENTAPSRGAAGAQPADLAGLRPVRARIRPER
jgi:hypothetical protein